MTVEALPRKAGPYLGNGTTSQFSFAFKTLAPDSLRVVEADDLGNEADLAYGPGYTVALNGNQDTSPGGTITRVAGNLPQDYRLTILSDAPYSQQTDIPGSGVIPPEVLERTLDVLAIQVQQLAEKTGRAVEVPPTSDLSVSALLEQIVTSGETAAQANATANDALATAAQANADATAALATVEDIATKSYVDGVIPAGSKMLFRQAAAPAGWTQDTTQNDRVLRVVSGAGGGTGGSWTIAGLTVGGTALSVAQIPSHQHFVMNTDSAGDGWPTTTDYLARNAAHPEAHTATAASVGLTSAAGGSGTHTHGLSSNGNWRPAYADVIVCSKN